MNRNSKLPQVGERVTCTYCNQKYIFVNYKKLRKKKGKVEAVEADVESGKGVKPTVSRYEFINLIIIYMRSFL